MASLKKPNVHGIQGIPHVTLLKADEYAHFIWSQFHLYMGIIRFFKLYNRCLISIICFGFFHM